LRSSSFAARLSPADSSASAVITATWWQAAQCTLIEVRLEDGPDLSARGTAGVDNVPPEAGAPGVLDPRHAHRPNDREARVLARGENGRVCQRVLMIANMPEGMEHEEAARLAGLSRSAAYEWHNRYEEEGIEGLRDRPRPGRQPRMDAATSARFKERILERRRQCRWHSGDQRLAGDLGAGLQDRSLRRGGSQPIIENNFDATPLQNFLGE
jgi:hypothetical protein